MSDVTYYQDEAAAARARIVGAVEQLGDRLSPQTIVREAKEEGRKALLGARDDGLRALLGVRDDGLRALGDVRDQASDAVDGVEDVIRDNPVVVGLGAIALGIAVTAARKRRAPDADRYGAYSSDDGFALDAIRSTNRTGFASRARAQADAVAERARRLATRAADTAAGVAGDARSAAARIAERAGDLGSKLGDNVSAAGDRLAQGVERARDGAADTRERLAEQARRAAETTGDAIGENPGAALAVGLVAGAMLALASED